MGAGKVAPVALMSTVPDCAPTRVAKHRSRDTKGKVFFIVSRFSLHSFFRNCYSCVTSGRIRRESLEGRIRAQKRLIMRCLHSGGCGCRFAPFGIGFDLFRTSVTDFEATDPEEDVFGDVGGMVGNAFEMARSQDEMEIWSGQCGILGHAGE